MAAATTESDGGSSRPISLESSGAAAWLDGTQNASRRPARSRFAANSNSAGRQGAAPSTPTSTRSRTPYGGSQTIASQTTAAPPVPSK